MKHSKDRVFYSRRVSTGGQMCEIKIRYGIVEQKSEFYFYDNISLNLVMVMTRDQI